MPKTKISEFDVDPANNTDINSINIAEGCAPSGINNAIRQLMSDLKEFQTGAGGDPVTVGGAFAANGGATLGDASGDALTINSSAVSIPNGLNFDSNTLVIDAGNNRVGVGTASPDALLQVSANNPTFKVTDTSTTGSVLINPDYFSGGADHIRSDINHLTIGTDAAKYVSLKTNDTERMRIDSSGNVGIGTTSPASLIHVQRSNDGTIGTFRGTSNAQLLLGISSGNLVYDSSNGNATHVWQANGTERMRIDSAGSLAIGLTDTDSTVKLRVLNTAGQAFSFNGSTGCGRFTNDDLNHYSITFTSKAGTSATHYQIGFFNSVGSNVGNITHNNSNTTYATSSDYRLKENIAPMTGALAVVGQLKPCTYTWKATGEASQGFIAHELQAVVPDAVVGEKDAVNEDGSIKPQGIDTSYLVATLTAAIQELKAEFDEYKATHP